MQLLSTKPRLKKASGRQREPNCIRLSVVSGSGKRNSAVSVGFGRAIVNRQKWVNGDRLEVEAFVEGTDIYLGFKRSTEPNAVVFDFEKSCRARFGDWWFRGMFDEVASLIGEGLEVYESVDFDGFICFKIGSK